MHKGKEPGKGYALSGPLPLLIISAVGVVYLLALAAMPPEGLTYHDTGAKYLQVRNLRLTPEGLDWSINYPARSLDPGLEFVPFSSRQHYRDAQGRVYLQWPIFLGLLTRIPWKVLGFWGLYVVPLLAGLGTLWATYLLALSLEVPRRIAWLAVLLAGLATPISIYSLLFFEHTLASMLVTFSLYALVSSLPRQEAQLRGGPAFMRRLSLTGGRAAALSAVLLALAIYFRSELYVLALVIASILAWQGWRRRAWRPFLTWTVAFVLSLVPLWAFYAISEGTILPLHATWYFAPSDASGSPVPGGVELPAIRYLATAGWRAIPDFLFGPQAFPSSPSLPVWAEIAGLAGAGLCVLAALLGAVRLRGLAAGRPVIFLLGLALILAAVLPVLLSGDSYYNLHGFLLVSPFAALALWRSEDRGLSREEGTASGLLYKVAWLYIVLHALVISAFSGLGPISRHEWGQRYLLPAYPALVALSLLAAYRIWTARANRKWRTGAASLWIVGALVLVGCGFSLRGYAALHDERTQVVAWQQLEQTLPGREPVVTDLWWLPLNLAPTFYARPLMLAEGDERLVSWANQMRERGVTSFGFMTADRSVFTGPWSAQVVGLSPDGAPTEARGMWLQRYKLSAR